MIFLPPIGKPRKSLVRYPFLTKLHFPHLGQVFWGFLLCTWRIIVLPLYSSLVHSRLYRPHAWYRKLLFIFIYLFVVIQIYKNFGSFLLFYIDFITRNVGWADFLSFVFRFPLICYHDAFLWRLFPLTCRPVLAMPCNGVFREFCFRCLPFLVDKLLTLQEIIRLHGRR